MPYLGPVAAGEIANRLNELRKSRAMNAQEARAVEHVLWRERRHGSDRAKVALTSIMDGCHERKEAVVEGFRIAEAHGLVRIIKGRQRRFLRGRWRSINDVNEYVFIHPASKSERRAVPNKNLDSSFYEPSQHVRQKAVDKFNRKHGAEWEAQAQRLIAMKEAGSADM
jgi:hypothetical protein